MIPVRTFGLDVKLFKMVGRAGADALASPFMDAQRTIDLTPYLGEGGSVRTTKGIREAAGGFSISFSDQMSPVGQDSLYGLIEPMDMIEIRATRSPELYQGDKLPLIMRGFVSRVARPESITGDGEPRRSVLVQGQDFGKLWIIHSVFPQVAIATGKLMVTAFGLNAATGIAVKAYNASDFMKAMTNTVMNPTIAALPAFGENQIAQFATDTVATVPGQIIPTQSGGLYGSLWSIISTVADRPWNELFIQDQEDGPHLVFREAPLKGIDGNLIMPNAVDPGIMEIDDADVVMMEVARSDSRVANFFWVPPGASSLDNNATLQALQLQNGTILDFDYANNNPKLFGEKKMETSMMLIPEAITQPVQKMPASDRPAALSQYNSWWLTRIGQLKAMNRDNSVWEDGAVTVCGNEDIVCGKYIRITRGNLVAESYVPSVSHTIMPLQTWTTQIELERGTGFMRRKELTAPYITEGRRGPYTPEQGAASKAGGTVLKGFTANGITFGPASTQ